MTKEHAFVELDDKIVNVHEEDDGNVRVIIATDRGYLSVTTDELIMLAKNPDVQGLRWRVVDKPPGWGE